MAEYGITSDVKLTAAEINERHRYGQSLYNAWQGHAVEIENVWKGEFETKDLRSDTFYARPSEGRSLLKKLDEMLGIRSQKRIAVLPHDGAEHTHQEQRAIDRLDTFLQAFLRCHRRATRQDWMRMASRMTVLYGRGPIHTVYMPEASRPPTVRVRTLDPLSTYAVLGHNGYAWFTREARMTGQQLRDYFEGMDEQYTAGMNKTLDEATLQGQYRMVEYWDSQVCAWAIGATIVDHYEHGYGRLTYQEMRLNEMPMQDERWASEGFLGPVQDAIKGKAIMRSRLITANETSYFNELIAVNQQGAVFSLNDMVKTGQWKEIGPGFQFQQIQKNVNHELWQMLYNAFSGEINENTLSKLAFALELPNISGFATSQVLSIIQDSLADIRDQMEHTDGLVLGDVLRLHEVFAPKEGWSYATSDRESVGRVTAADIGGRYEVEVGIKVALPQDKMSKIAAFNQLPDLDIESRLMLSQLDEDIEDKSEVLRRSRLEWLKANNPDVAQKFAAFIEAENERELRSWEKAIQKAQRRRELRAQKEAQQAITRGVSQDVVIPATLTPSQLHQVATLEDQGQTRAAALKMVLEGSLPRGVPGMDSVQPQGQGEPAPQALPPELQQVMAQLFPGAQPMPAGPDGDSVLPDGFTGYDQGIPQQVLPTPMRGAQPRQGMDQDRLELEGIEHDNRPGAIPRQARRPVGYTR